jgi:cell wall-associated NlpC family hydrolase
VAGQQNNSKRKRWMRLGLTVTLLMSIMVVSACAATQPAKNKQSQSPSNIQSNQAVKPSHSAQSGSETTKGLSIENQAKLSLTSQGGIQYVDAKQLIGLLGLQSKWDASSATYKIGDIDVNYVLKMNSKVAQKQDDSIKLASAPIMIHNSPAIPVSALADLFQQDMTYSVNGNELIVQGTQQDTKSYSINGVNDQAKDPSLNFADDPQDPNKKQFQPVGAMLPDISVMNEVADEESIPVGLQNIDIPTLVWEAKRYLGVKYIFGAKPYPQDNGFDCSSYTRYIFGKYGIGLSRTARDQANQGITVGRNDLRTGDLLFFNVPGRFKSNKAVGHVGIYLGNNVMINAKPKSGVQYTNINSAYWKRVYLFAKRVAV